MIHVNNTDLKIEGTDEFWGREINSGISLREKLSDISLILGVHPLHMELNKSKLWAWCYHRQTMRALWQEMQNYVWDLSLPIAIKETLANYVRQHSLTIH